MPSANVSWPVPLIRMKPWYAGQFGVPGTDSERGLRSDVNGTIFYVDPNAVGVSDQRDGTDPEEPLATVAAALTHCQAYRGDVIAVMPSNAWQYGNAADLRLAAVAEEVTVTVPGVRIVGVAPSAALGVIWTPASDRGTCITVHALDVTIEGFLFTEGAYSGCNAIYAEWDGATCWGDNLVVRHCVFDDSVDTAIQLEYAWYCDIHHNLFWACDQYGVYVDPAGSGIAYCIIHKNLFYGIATGAVTIPGSDYCKVAWNQFYNATAMGAGASADVYVTTAGGNQNMIDHNDMACDAGPGNGDYNDTNSPSGAVPELDAWIENYLPGGPTTGAPT